MSLSYNPLNRPYCNCEEPEPLTSIQYGVDGRLKEIEFCNNCGGTMKENEDYDN